MTIFGFAKYLAKRLIQQPSMADGPKPYASNAGNIFFALFAAVGMVGAVGYGFNSVLRGPIASMTETTRRTVAESTLITSSRMAIVGATTQQAGAGDTDNDGFIEPVPYRDAATAPHPTGGGYLPAALNIPNTIDPWNTEYGYCAWDHGSVTASSRRLVGSPNNNRHAIAIISAGKDKRFQTSCVAYVDDTTNLIVRTPGSDDIVLAYTYAEANDLGNGLWKPHATAPNTAVTDKNIDVTGSGTVSGGVVLSGNTATGGGLILPSDPGDDSISGICDAMNDNQLRYNTSDPLIPPVIEICDAGGLGWSPVSGGAGGDTGATTGQLVAHYKFDEIFGTTARDATGNHNGTLYNNPVWAPGQGRIGGALRFSGNSTNSYVRVPRAAALEPSSVTVSMWARRTGAQDTWSGLITKTHNNNSSPVHHSYGMYFDSSSDDTIWIHKGVSGSTNSTLSTPNFMQDNTWYHLTMVIDPAGTAPQQRLYINGVLDVSNTNSTPITYDSTNAGDLYIGSTQSNSGEKFTGFIDDVRIYNYGMTNEEVLTLYAASNPTSMNLETPQKAGAVYSWGVDTNGKLGNGTAETASRTAPGPLETTTDFIDISAGVTHACGVKSDGTAWCWGSDSFGKLGNGSGVTADQPVPYQVPGLSNILKISSGQLHTCALRNDGAVFCWGNNPYGALGDGSITIRESPVQVIGLANAVDVSAGYDSTCAVVADGSGWCWGLGTGGQLGNGLSTSSRLPVQVSTVTDFTQITLGRMAADDPSCGVTRSGKAYCWGADTSQQLGDGSASATATTPVEVINTAENFSKISVNDNTVCAIVASTGGTVACWGQGGQGQIGNGTTPASTHTPTFVSGISGIIDIAVGNNSVCAVENNGNVWCWGEDHATYGRLGNGDASTATSSTPVLAKIMNAYKITGSGDSFFALVDTSVQASAAPPQYTKKFSSAHSDGDALHSCHIRGDGTMWCWGWEQFGELGNGGASSENAASPVRVTDPGPWMSVSTGTDHTCGIKVDGSAWCWGSDTSGQIGDGGTAGPQVSPVAVAATTPAGTATIPWVQIVAGFASTCGIKADGAAYCWGDDSAGSLGNGAGGSSNAPGAAIQSSLPWIQLSADYTTCGIKSDNSLWCWGWAGNGRLGNGTTSPNLQSPAQIGTDSWRYIDTTGPCGIKTDGSLWCWGPSTAGRLGVGTTYTGDQTVPRLVVEPGPWASVKGTAWETVGCGVKMDGTGWCWGDNLSSLGIGSVPAADATSPLPVVGKDWVHIDGGADFFRCGIKNDDSVWCWGDDSAETLGNGAGNNSSNAPQRIYQPYKTAFSSADATTTTYAATTAANLAIGTTPLTNVEGTAQGLSFPGSGRSLLTQATTANQFMLETSSAGGAAQIWLNGNGLPYYMGYNAYTGGLEFGLGWDWLYTNMGASLEVANDGFTGIGTSGAPVAKLDVRGAVKPGDAGATCNAGLAGTLKYSGTSHTYCNGSTWIPFGYSATGGPLFWDARRFTIEYGETSACGITSNGNGYCWGLDDRDQLGNGAGSTTRATPFPISGASGWIQIAVGRRHACGIKVGGTLWCWGEGTSGSLGLGGTSSTSSPMQVGAATWKMVSTSADSHTCGIQTNGRAYCWGVNTNGRLGDNTTTSRSTPTQVTDTGGSISPGIFDWISISAGYNSTCGVRANGEAYCWGLGTSGRLGRGSTGSSFVPVLVQDTTGPGGFGDWVSVTVGDTHACGIRTNGEAWCWGDAGDGQLGNGSDGSQTRPDAVHNASTATPTFKDWVMVDAGEKHTCGLRATGQLYCWGEGGTGKLGNGAGSDRPRPTLVAGGFSDWVTVGVGEDGSCGTRANGLAYCWGTGSSSQIGDGGTSQRNSPTLVVTP